jgi:hypothetical protein
MEIVIGKSHAGILDGGYCPLGQLNWHLERSKTCGFKKMQRRETSHEYVEPNCRVDRLRRGTPKICVNTNRQFAVCP